MRAIFCAGAFYPFGAGAIQVGVDVKPTWRPLMNSRNALRPSVLLGAALAAALLSSTSFATDRPDGVPVVTVRYTQTELSNTSGASNVYARIRNAARMVCGDSGRSLNE